MQPRDFFADKNNAQSMPAPRDFFADQIAPKESIGEAFENAPGRIITDVSQKALNAFNAIPEYYEAAKTEVPGLFSSLKNNPLGIAKQGVAGLAELGQNIFNTPHDVINYLSTRLNLVPENINKIVQMARMPADTEQMINETFGQPQAPGEALARGIGRNAELLSGGAGVLKGINNLRPSVFARKKVNQIRNEYNNALNEQAEAYRVPDQRYGNNIVTINPEEYLKNSGIDKKRLYPDAKIIYDEFMKNPSFGNLHKLQSQIGNDWSKINLKFPNRSQLFRQYRESLKNRAENFLHRDPEALESYKRGSDITANVLKPYEANQKLKNIVLGSKKKPTANELKKAIQQGAEKISYKKGKEVVTKIPEGHALHNHLNDIEKFNSRNNLLTLGLGGLTGYELGVKPLINYLTK